MWPWKVVQAPLAQRRKPRNPLCRHINAQKTTRNEAENLGLSLKFMANEHRVPKMHEVAGHTAMCHPVDLMLRCDCCRHRRDPTNRRLGFAFCHSEPSSSSVAQLMSQQAIQITATTGVFVENGARGTEGMLKATVLFICRLTAAEPAFIRRDACASMNVGK